MKGRSPRRAGSTTVLVKRIKSSHWRSSQAATWISQVLLLIAILSPLIVYWLADLYHFGQVDYWSFHLQADELPSDLNLKLRLRRTKDGTECRNYGVEEDVYFGRYNGVHCDMTKWETTEMEESPGRFIKTFELVTKTFASANDAHEYYWRFWGRHMYQPLPYQLLTDMTPSSPTVGIDPHVFMWDPALVNPTTLSTAPLGAQQKHVLFMFRQGRVIVKAVASGHMNSLAMDLTPLFLSSLCKKIAERIRTNDPGTIARRYAQLHNQVKVTGKQAALSFHRHINDTLALMKNQAAMAARLTFSNHTARWNGFPADPDEYFPATSVTEDDDFVIAVTDYEWNDSSRTERYSDGSSSTQSLQLLDVLMFRGVKNCELAACQGSSNVSYLNFPWFLARVGLILTMFLLIGFTFDVL